MGPCPKGEAPRQRPRAPAVLSHQALLQATCPASCAWSVTPLSWVSESVRLCKHPHVTLT